MYFIPQPRKIEYKEAGEGQNGFVLSYQGYIVLDPSCGNRITRQAALVQKALEEKLGFALALTRGEGRKGDVILEQCPQLGKEDYILTVDAENVRITGGEAGVWYGCQTLQQMVDQCGAVLPFVQREAGPDIPNRGFYHDVTRGRVPKLSFLKKMADRMAYYKMNQLQLYIEHTFLFRDFSEIWRDDTPLTAEEIMELDQYCLERGIELVPSLSCFGHLYKVLSSKGYSHLCELEGADQMPFSLRGRMHHHTINVTDPESLEFIKGKIREFMPLFTSRQFNICADETFDLGKGKSRAAAEEKGVDRIYIDFVKALCEFLVENGRRPMFWGDIICGFPEMIKELPEETICLNWGYAKYQREDETKWLYDAGAVQYSCPGACGWNQFVYLIENSYENIRRMCSYAVKYHSIGVLNTDWGDFLHVNHPEFGVVGMIYGAAFSWNGNIPSFDEINRQISRLEFGDEEERFVSIAASVAAQKAFDWETAIRFKELGEVPEFTEDHKAYISEHMGDMDGVDEKNKRLEEISRDFYGSIVHLKEGKRELVKPYLAAVDAVRLFNELGKVVTAREYGRTYSSMPDAWKLAEELEKWLYHYKEIYRSVSKESELYRIQELIVWYGDYLRMKEEQE